MDERRSADRPLTTRCLFITGLIQTGFAAAIIFGERLAARETRSW